MLNLFKNNKMKIIYLCLFLTFVVLTFCFSTFILPVNSGDEIWCYGFSYNISIGMIPYRDFSMLQTPLYFYIGSIFIMIFGNFLFSLHIFNAIFISFIMLMLFKMSGWKSILLYPFLIITLFPSYNYLCLFFLFLIIYLIYEKKDNVLNISFIIGLIFMTKQNIGIVMLVPLLYYSNKKVKSFFIFLIPFFIFSLYFIYNGNFCEFIDHCFFGMLDFNENNKLITFFSFIEILEVLFMIVLLFKKKFRDQTLFYILSFQIMSYPIFDLFHWIIAFIPFLYYLYSNFDIRKIRRIFYLVNFIIIVGISVSVIGGTISYLISSNIVIENDKDNYLYLRNLYLIEKIDLDSQVNIINKYNDRYDYQFFIMGNSYLRKLYMGFDINKYDLFLNGNMGYKGDIKKIKEMDELCSCNSCVFFVDNDMFIGNYTQFSRKIYNYVIDNFKKIDEYKYFDVYDNISD